MRRTRLGLVRVIFSGAHQLAAPEFMARRGYHPAPALEGEAGAWKAYDGKVVALVPWGPGALALEPRKTKPRQNGGAWPGKAGGLTRG